MGNNRSASYHDEEIEGATEVFNRGSNPAYGGGGAREDFLETATLKADT